MSTCAGVRRPEGRRLHHLRLLDLLRHLPEAGHENLKAASRVPDPEGGGSANLNWGFAWPANRRIMYNRASARPDGAPWSEEKKWVYWDPDKVDEASGKAGMWTGADVPDFPPTKPPDAKAHARRHRPGRRSPAPTRSS